MTTPPTELLLIIGYVYPMDKYISLFLSKVLQVPEDGLGRR
jgi:hypothetical protein